jgi:hypothetical protein
MVVSALCVEDAQDRWVLLGSACCDVLGLVESARKVV